MMIATGCGPLDCISKSVPHLLFLISDSIFDIRSVSNKYKISDSNTESDLFPINYFQSLFQFLPVFNNVLDFALSTVTFQLIYDRTETTPCKELVKSRERKSNMKGSWVIALATCQ